MLSRISTKEEVTDITAPSLSFSTLGSVVLIGRIGISPLGVDIILGSVVRRKTILSKVFSRISIRFPILTGPIRDMTNILILSKRFVTTGKRLDIVHTSFLTIFIEFDAYAQILVPELLM